VIMAPTPDIRQLRYLGVGAGTGAVIPPMGSKITLSDQTRPVQHRCVLWSILVC
jgi:hypothetical protein